MGTVYAARDPVIDRLVAIKTIRFHDDMLREDAEDYRRRFERETKAVGLVNHPNVVMLHDAGEDEETGLAFMALEHVAGATLDQALKGGVTFAPPQVAVVISQVAAALDAAHGAGVVHRDVKPGNIILTTEGGCKLTDFGIALVPNLDVTRTGQILGTPSPT